ncbi:hypothetical protein [Kitasatospora sp. NPDC085464]|uniref:hypothetical protein n=1 Tax=Kitasatospora sp. NPDC085464 TaxID=3364063 RepID=UPI0037CBC19C
MPTANLSAPLDPLNLGGSVVSLASVALVAQARALAVARQQDVAEHIADPFLALSTRDGQEEFRTEAAYYLDRLLPGVFTSMSDAEVASHLVNAVPEASAADGGSATDLVDALVAQFSQCQAAAEAHAAALREASSRAAARKAELEATLKEAISALQGPDGEIQKTRRAIDDTVKALDRDLAAVVSGGEAIGAGVTKFLGDKIELVTGVLAKFGGTDSSDGKKKQKNRDTPGGPDEQAESKPPGKSFEVEGVALDKAGDEGSQQSSHGAADFGAALASYQAHNAALADLYHALAEQGAELAVAAAISDQAENFARSVGGAAAAATDLAACWQSLVDRAVGLAHSSPADVAAGAAAAAPRWAALSLELAHARAAVTGRASAIPDVGMLPTMNGR